jgi:hypothetical protein
VLERKSVTACLFASSFNNPLGCTMPDARKLELLQLLTKHSVPLIEDDIYGDIYFGGERPKPFGARPGGGYDLLQLLLKNDRARLSHRLARRRASHASRSATEAGLDPRYAGADAGGARRLLSCGGYDSHLRRIRRVFAENIDRMVRAIERGFQEGNTGVEASRRVGHVGRVARGHARPVRRGGQARHLLCARRCVLGEQPLSALPPPQLRLSWDRPIEAGVETIGTLAGTQAGLKAI